MKKFLIPSSGTSSAAVVNEGAPIHARATLAKDGEQTAAMNSSPFAASGPALGKRNSPKPAILTPSVHITNRSSVPNSVVEATVSLSGNNGKFQRSFLQSRQRDALNAFITWNEGESVPYYKIVDIFEEISAVSGRLDKEHLMSKLFTAVLTSSPQDLESVVYLASNTIHPAYDGLELGVGDSLLVKAICEATGRKKDAVEDAYEKEGDLGEVALQSRANQKTLGFSAKPKPLHAAYVLDQFRAIAQIKGEKAQARKVEVIKSLMVRCQGQEAKYLVRALQGKLRIGTAFQTVLVALSQTFVDMQAAFLSEYPPASYAAEHPTPANPVPTENSPDQSEELITSIVALSADEAMTLPIETKERYLQLLLRSVKESETPEARTLRAGYVAQPNVVTPELYDAAEIAIKRAFSECPNLSLVIGAAVQYPLHVLYQRCRLLLGVPVAPMLAKPTKEIGEVLRRLESQAFTMEYKYDGERAQVHFWLPSDGAQSSHATQTGAVKIFSRNLEDNSNKYPDLKEVVVQARLPFMQSCIVDAEVVAYDREKQTLLPFQILSTRKRKMETIDEPGMNFKNAGTNKNNAADSVGTANSNANTNNNNSSNNNNNTFEEPKVKVILEVFDLLQINGQSLLRESLRTRRAMLRLAFQPSASNYFRFADGADHVENGDTAPIETLLAESCAHMCEGLMVKTLDAHASYEPSKRSLNWLKVKKDYIAGMGACDSVDLVPIGAYFGRGKRSGVFGAYLMACYEPEKDVFQSVCKVGTGFTDEMLQHLYTKMSRRVLNTSKKPSYYDVGDMLHADVWFTAASNTQMQDEDDGEDEVINAVVAKEEEGKAEKAEEAIIDTTTAGETPRPTDDAATMEEDQPDDDDNGDDGMDPSMVTRRSAGDMGGCVWEIQAADLSRSSVHRGGVGRLDKHEDAVVGDIRGIGLRFPRFLRERDDKKPDQATSAEQIVDMFFSQSGIEKKDEDEGDEWI
jgi:DNA ligase-1